MMNKKSLEEIKVLKPSLIVPVFSTIILLGALLGMIMGIADWKTYKLLYLVLVLVCCICTVILWCNYIAAYKNYKDAYKKICGDV